MQARLGEIRVVPVVLKNERRRDREITLELSSFTTRGGKPAPVVGVVVGERTFTLKACEERAVTIALAIRPAPTGDKADEGPRLEDFIRAAGGERYDQLPDVDECIVAYADLCLQGCDVRAVRIAVAILPRDCDAYEVHCACGCC
jgi:hypothetical protein